MASLFMLDHRNGGEMSRIHLSVITYIHCLGLISIPLCILSHSRQALARSVCVSPSLLLSPYLLLSFIIIKL